MEKSDIIFQLNHITQEFPGVKALDDVSFSVRRGRIHALVGENGAGKSTLIKVLAGINTHFQGEVFFNGQLFHPKNPNESQQMGISVVHQELKLAETLSVTENMFLGNLMYKGKLVDWKGMRKKAREMLQSLHVELDENALVDTLSVAQKQIVEICKAMNHNCQVLIMDEPSAVLTDRELDILFDVIDRLVKSGVTILYISHKFDEIFQICQDVTVLRDGKHIDTLPIEAVTRQSLINMMVGREMGMEYPKEIIELGEPLLQVEGLGQQGVFGGVDFTLHKGEILGISGLVGAGRTELVKAILGIEHITEGTITYKGEKIVNKNFKEAIQRGFGLVPESRKEQGLVQMFSVKENICMVSMDKVIEGGVIRNSKVKEYAGEYVKKLRIATPGIDTEVQYLSGGNQQKVVIAKWLMEDCDVIILDEPTRGIDIGAKSEIYGLMTELVKKGKGVIMISSEMPEIIGMCDNVIIMHERRMAGMLEREELSQQKIMSYCT